MTIQHQIVQIQVKNKITEETTQGTGLLYKPFKNPNLIYLITCSHNFPKLSELSELRISLKSNFDTQPLTITTIEDIIRDNQLDIAIVVIKSYPKDLEIIKWTEKSLDPRLISWGYPDAFQNTKCQLDEIKLEKNSIEHTFLIFKKINSTTPNDSGQNRTSLSIIKGVSGAPIFINNTNYLLGIISEYQDMDRILASPIQALNNLLKNKGYAEEPIWSSDAYFFMMNGKATLNERFVLWNEWVNTTSDLMYFSEYASSDNTLNRKDALLSALKNNKNIRITGLSGLGKTRFALEVFRNEDQFREQVIYLDSGGKSEIKGIENWLDRAITDKVNLIFIIDNCILELHKKIIDITSNTSIKIITIDNEVKEKGVHHRSNVLPIEITKEGGIVTKILKANSINQARVDWIVKYAEDFPLMAKLLMQIENPSEEKIGYILDKIMVKKLIFSKEEFSQQEYSFLEIISIFSYVTIPDFNTYNTTINPGEKLILDIEGQYLARLCKLEYSTFLSFCAKYEEKGILERKGRFIYLKPLPLALNLAINWWQQQQHPDSITKFFSEFIQTGNLAEKAVERLENLDSLDEAKNIVATLWKQGSPFCQAEFLNTWLGSRLFRSIVVVNPDVALNALSFNYSGASLDELKNINEGRRNLVWALEKLCFRKSTFKIASQLLYSLAAAENEYISNNATGQLIRLFQIYLPCTESNLTDRFDLIKWGGNQSDLEYKIIAIKACGNGLTTSGFYKMGGAEEQGTTKLEDYIPNINEIHKYWDLILDELEAYIYSRHKILSPIAEDFFVDRIINLNISNFNYPIEKVKERILRVNAFLKHDVWLDMLNDLKSKISIFKPIGQTESVLLELIEQLTPESTDNKIKSLVCLPNWGPSIKNEHDEYINQSTLIAQKLARELLSSHIQITPYLNLLLQGEQRQTFAFAYELAQSEFFELNELFVTQILDSLSIIPHNERNPSFLIGLISGRNNHEFRVSIYQAILKHAILNYLAFEIIKFISPKLSDFLLLIETFSDSSNLQYFEQIRGVVSNNLDDKSTIIFCKKLETIGKKGEWLALLQLEHYYYDNPLRFTESESYLRSLVTKYEYLLNDQYKEYLCVSKYIKAVINLLKNKNDSSIAIKVSKQIIELCSKQESMGSSYEQDMSLLLAVLIDQYFDDTWELIGSALISDNFLTYWNIKSILVSDRAFFLKNSLLAEYPNNYAKIIDWANKYIPIAPRRLISISPLGIKVKTDEDNAIYKTQWHAFTLLLIDAFNDIDGFLDELDANMGSWGAIGSAIPVMQERKELALLLQGHKSPKVKNWAMQQAIFYKKREGQEKMRDEERSI